MAASTTAVGASPFDHLLEPSRGARSLRLHVKDCRIRGGNRVWRAATGTSDSHSPDTVTNGQRSLPYADPTWAGG